MLAELLNNTQTPAWISFSCRDGEHLNDGSAIKQAAGLFSDHAKVAAIGINCTAPKHISKLVTEIQAAAPDKSIIVYPNSGELYDASRKAWISTDDAGGFSRLADLWRQQGVQIIGGCCRIGPSLINSLKVDLAS